MESVQIHLQNPLPVALVGLSLLLPGVWLAGRSLARACGVSAAAEALVTPALALAAWLLAVHSVGRLTGSFSMGLTVGTVTISIVGIAAWIIHARSGAPGASTRRPRLPRRMWAGALIATIVFAPTAILWAFHDEVFSTGHMAFSAQMQNDVYPPRFFAFPTIELRYHYGFNILVAAVTALTRLRLDHAIDAVTIGCWFYTFCLVFMLGERIVGRRWGALVAFVTLFGGGLLFFGISSEATPLSPYIGPRHIQRMWLNPPLVSYFFQHPFTLGLPIALAFLLLLSERGYRASYRYLALSVLLTALSLSQIVLYLTIAGAALVEESLAGPPASRRRPLSDALRGRISIGRALAMAATIALSLLCARTLGGFFAKAPGPAQPFPLVFHVGVVDTLGGGVEWMIGTFGLLLPLGLAGAALVRRQRALLVTLIAGNLALVFCCRYPHTWDIVKFATVASLALSITSSAAIAWLLSRRPAAVFKPLGAAMTAVVMAAGLAFVIVFGLDMKGVSSIYHQSPPKLSMPDAAAAQWLRTHMKPGESVYRSSQAAATAYAVWGGLPGSSPGAEEATAFGLENERIERRKRILRDLPADVDVYLRERIRWLVLAPADARLLSLSEAWEREGRARRRAEMGPLRVIELLPKAPQSAPRGPAPAGTSSRRPLNARGGPRDPL
jgi:hypothetical protein